MGERGRPPKPTNLAVLHGDGKKNPGRVNRQEPKPSNEPVAPPYQLTAAVREVWDRLAPDRIAKGLLTSWDVDAFAAFCEALVILHRAPRGANAKPVAGGPSPMTKFKDAVALCATLGGRFGWTPSDRAKLAMPEQSNQPGEDLLSG